MERKRKSKISPRLSEIRTCLISLPWDYYQSPSVAIGTLAGYIRHKGFQVDAFHLHLETAVLFGPEIYDILAYKYPVIGETLCASLLLPEDRDRLLEYAGKTFADAEECAHLLSASLKRVYESYDWSQYHLVGFTIHFAQLFSSLLFASWIKRDHPHIRTVLGGGFITIKHGISVLRQFPQMDWCIHGEGEEALVSLLTGLDKKEDGFEKNVPGLIYRSDESIKANEKSQLKDLDGLPDPDYDHYFHLKTSHPLVKDCSLPAYIPVEVGRGCCYCCAFCNFRTDIKYRIRPSSEVSSSIKRLTAKHNTDSIALMALMLPPDSLDKLFDSIASHGRDYRIFCESLSNLTKPQLIKMKKAGVTEIQIGLEAFDTRLLRKMNKYSRFIDNLQIMKHLEELGIRSYSFLILGFPTETQSDIDRSFKAIDYACAYEPPREIGPFSLREGSLVDQSPEKYGLYATKDVGLFSDVLFIPEERRMEFQSFVPVGVKEIHFWFKDYKSRRKSRDYRDFLQRIEKWKKSYEKALLAGRPLLSYLDCKRFLTIEDFRDSGPQNGTRIHGRFSLKLEGWKRELYLFCDSIRKQEEIEGRFPGRDIQEIKRTLNQFVRLKVMYSEGNSYLSLATSAGPRNRRNMTFPWT